MAFSGFTRMLNEKRLSACHRSELCKLVSLIFIRQCVSCRFSIAVICKWGSIAYANETAAYETGNSCKWTLQKSLWSWCNPSLVSTIFLQASFREDEDERGVGGWGGGVRSMLRKRTDRKCEFPPRRKWWNCEMAIFRASGRHFLAVNKTTAARYTSSSLSFHWLTLCFNHFNDYS